MEQNNNFNSDEFQFSEINPRDGEHYSFQKASTLVKGAAQMRTPSS